MEDQTELTGNLPWSPAGIELLTVIHKIIEDSGGHIELYKRVMSEGTLNTFQKYDYEKRQGFKMVVKNKIPYRHAAVLMEIPYNDFCRQISQFKKQHVLE